MTFLRTVRDGPTDRSYGVHVADLAGVPEPVVDRSREVLDRLREEKAIEARGGGGEPVQAVFDLGSGEFKTAEASGTGGDPSGGPNAAGDAGAAGAVGDADATADAGDSADATADAGDSAGATADGGRDPETVLQEEYGEGAPEVLDRLASVDVSETPPVELMATVQEWQERLDDS